MRILLFLFAVLFTGLYPAQNTISYKGCPNIFDNQNFTFSNTGTDAQGKRIYITTPLDGDQPCGGTGACEFMIQWNQPLMRWEFLADDGRGDFSSPYLIYYNSTGGSQPVNPPALSTGVWIENTAVTMGECGGNMAAANTVLTGDLHSSTLGITDISTISVSVYPNPVVSILHINHYLKHIKIFDRSGRLERVQEYGNQLNAADLPSGIYLLTGELPNGEVVRVKFVKK